MASQNTWQITHLLILAKEIITLCKYIVKFEWKQSIGVVSVYLVP
jgi:hypothetical protein